MPAYSNFSTQLPLLPQYSVVTAQRMSCMNTEDTWMYEDGSDDIVFTVDRPCQLLGVGLCGTDAAYSAELDLLEVIHA